MSDDFYYSPVYNSNVNRIDGVYEKQNDGTYLFNNK